MILSYLASCEANTLNELKSVSGSEKVLEFSGAISDGLSILMLDKMNCTIVHSGVVSPFRTKAKWSSKFRHNRHLIVLYCAVIILSLI